AETDIACVRRKRNRADQEFVLRWSSDGGSSFREIVRQQWNFSPAETIREVEEYQVELSSVTVVELTIVPNTSGGSARGSLKSLSLSCLATIFFSYFKKNCPAREFPRRAVCWPRLERSNVFRLEAFGPLGDVKFDR